ncbi:MAG: PPC domain-containing protein [Gemmatimonadales bacterium]
MRRSAIAVACALLAAAPLAAQQARTIAVGQTQDGQLVDSDPIARSRKAPYHTWTLEGRRGQRLVIDLRSTDFDAYLVLRDDAGFLLSNDDDSGGENNARIHTILPRDGRYEIIATGFRENSRGRYSLSVTGWEAPAGPAPGAPGTIAVGEAKDGILEPGDEVAGDGPYQDRWTFEARAGQRLRLDMTSTDVDSYLILLGPDGAQLATDDDGGGNKNASIGFRAVVAGRYTALATSYGESVKAGAYQLRLTEENGTFADPGVASELSPGQTSEGRLETGDFQGKRGLEDRWTFTGRAGQMARVDVVSTAFDSYAMLLFNGMPVDSNDDGGDGNNARLMTILPGTGTYTVAVSAYGSSSSGGRYTIALQLSDAPAGAGRIETIRPGAQATGRLEPGDRQHGGGGYEDLWEFDARANQDVMIEMHSSDFDAYLELRDPSGNLVQQNDDGGTGTDALIMAHLEHAGRYRIVARSYGDRTATGVYDLSLSSVGESARPGRVVELREGQLAVGRLEPGDSLVGDSTYADIFLFRAPRDGDITIDLASGDFDAFLIVRDAEGATLATDDDGGDGTNSRLTLHVQSGQTYRIIANSYGEDRATGLYRLTARYTH